MVQGVSLKKERDSVRQRERERERERISENYPEKNKVEGDDREILSVRGSCVLLLNNSEVQREIPQNSQEAASNSANIVYWDLIIAKNSRCKIILFVLNAWI